MCRHIGSSKQSGFYTPLSSSLWLNRTLCGITWQYILLGKKENNIAEKEGLLFPLPFARNKENGNIESRILKGCVNHTLWNRFILCRLRGKDCRRRGCILKHCPVSKMNLQESRIFFCQKYPHLAIKIMLTVPLIINFLSNIHQPSLRKNALCDAFCDLFQNKILAFNGWFWTGRLMTSFILPGGFFKFFNIFYKY